ncbi:hypothetical protein [Pseudanabaena yagii]|uniref:DUF4435 domain-containing protein n=1 Tax=Pseudanabaena yagii GIHE-NHR1 TaxID=2722753 RepID=A0ABX1LXX4_9CYAN|nr:hypothetical protein [Pseudanabaena yagii]NMF60321.1 DUF4435 domain-containing protein [Pseudanabaena yagii GIHE-NHR1]
MSRGISLSENEIVSYLKKTSLPTILVEGRDELSVYTRYLESKINIEDVDVLPCQGRVTLLNVFDRREEFKHKKVVFVADKDMWFFVGIPQEKRYEEYIVFTDGYSLENDLYIESQFSQLLDKKEIIDFYKLIKELSIWFAFEVNRYIKTGSSQCNFDLHKICPNNVLDSEFKQKINFVNPPQELVDKIYSDYTRALRGKNLFQALLKFLSTQKHSNLGRENLLELGARFRNPRIELLVSKIVQKFQEYS